MTLTAVLLGPQSAAAPLCPELLPDSGLCPAGARGGGGAALYAEKLRTRAVPAHGANLASITSNCAAMGTACWWPAPATASERPFSTGLFGGWAPPRLMSFAGLRGEVSLDQCPKCFQGMPIELITAAHGPVLGGLLRIAPGIKGHKKWPPVGGHLLISAGRRHTRCPCSWWGSCRSSPR